MIVMVVLGVTATATPPRLTTWLEWLGLIRQDILELGENRATFREMLRIYDLNPTLATNAYFFDWLAGNYATTMAVGIRRQRDTNPDSVSMARLLEDLQANAATVTRAWFVSTYAGSPMGDYRGNRDFDTFAPGGGPCLDPAIVRQDYDALQTLAKPLKKYVDKRIAHHDAKGHGVTATYAELDAALDEFRRLLQRYFLLLEQGALSPDVTIQMPWTDIFLTPWQTT
jgi:hypothetical protein